MCLFYCSILKLCTGVCWIELQAWRKNVSTKVQDFQNKTSLSCSSSGGKVIGLRNVKCEAGDCYPLTHWKQILPLSTLTKCLSTWSLCDCWQCLIVWVWWFIMRRVASVEISTAHGFACVLLYNTHHTLYTKVICFANYHCGVLLTFGCMSLHILRFPFTCVLH